MCCTCKPSHRGRRKSWRRWICKRYCRRPDGTNGATAPANYTVPIYAQIKPTDSSETLLATVNNRVLDITNNYQDLGINLALSIRAGNYIWSRTIPKTFIGMDQASTNLIKK